MAIKFLARFLGAAALLAVARPAFAGEFSVNCFYKNENLKKCASAVSDIVTDKFTRTYPNTRFEIFAHSNIIGFSNGGYSAYAVTGVIPKNSGEFPLSTFSSTNINGSDTRFNQIELANIELKVYRAAVQNLMEQCEISPNCDVYMARQSRTD